MQSHQARMTLNIPKFQWERFQAALRKNTRDFITDCAEYIGVPSKDLITRVQKELAKDPTTLAFFETDEAECTAYKTCGSFAYYCRKPSLTNTAYCHEHQYHRPNLTTISSVVSMRRLALPEGNTMPDAWLEEITGRVYTVDKKCIGFFDKETEALTLFITEDLDADSRDGLSDVSTSFEDNMIQNANPDVI